MTEATVSLGSNAIGRFGSPEQNLQRCLAALDREAGPVLRVSRILQSAPVGPVSQAPFANQIVVLKIQHSAAELLRIFKRLEHLAGRRTGTSRRWGPRPLDIDLIDFGGLVNGWHRITDAHQPTPARCPLTLPHPQAHLRRFVMAPLLEVTPGWWHPALGASGRQLLHRLGGSPFRPAVPLEH
jgi:2-amino-4-hydroxy-6-hydroxymethyldihydropteridine diphosphokinase